jgi:hypothetical protein
MALETVPLIRNGKFFFVFNLSAYARQAAPIRRGFPGIFFAG